MKFNGTSWRMAALVLAVSAGLGGCVGDGGTADVADVITGTVSDGKALANTQVLITDASKSDSAATTVMTDENGQFSFTPGARTYPFLLSVTVNDKTYFSVVTGTDKHVNINPASTVITQYALRASNAGSSVNINAITRVSAAQLAGAEQMYLQTVRADSALAEQLFDVSPRTKDFRSETGTRTNDAYGEYLSLIDVSIRHQDGRMVVLNRSPIRLGSPAAVVHAGATDDLLTAGLDAAGLDGPAPGYPDIFDRTKALRANSIYNQFHALVDLTAAGGYGSLYSKVSKIPGTEYLTYSDDGTGKQNVSTLVQIPDSFNLNAPCILVVPASGLRGVYGALPTAEWALRRGCAVAATDKGAGVGTEYLDTGDSTDIEGRMANIYGLSALQFQSGLTQAQRLERSLNTPGRFGFKFAHSQQNPEKHWGRNVLDAAKLAFYLLNEKYGNAADIGTRKLRAIKPEQTVVIVAGDGEGGGAALAAVEQDQLGIIDGAVALQPQVQLRDGSGVSVVQGSGAVAASGKALVDYMSYANLYQPCAALTAGDAPGASLVDATAAANRCSALRKAGLLAADTLAGQVAEAIQKLRAYGWQTDSDVLHGASYMMKTAGAAPAYANAYGKFSVSQALCGLSYGTTDAAGMPKVVNDATKRTFLATEVSGLLPGAGIDLIYDTAANSNEAPISEGQYNKGVNWKKAVSPSTGLADYAFDSAYCLRKLALGRDPVSGAVLTEAEQKLADAIKAGVAEVGLSSALQGRPAIVVHGRADSAFPVNHSSRPYVAKSLAVQGAGSKLRYYEVLNAQHFEGALGKVSGFDTRYVPLRPYLLQSLDLMYNHLTLGKALPESQVVRTVPRGGSTGAAPAITTANAPAIANSPAAADLIQFSNSTLSIPN